MASAVTGPAPLARLFAPRAIALVGHHDGAAATAPPLRFLRRHGYSGAVYPVSPRRRRVGGLTTYPDVAALPRPVDVAWIGLPWPEAIGAVQECGRAGVPFAVIPAGAGGVDGMGAVEQARLHATAAAAGVRLVGPSTVGFVNGWDKVALTFSTVAELGSFGTGALAILSQSGALGSCLLDRAVGRSLGAGLFVSTGHETDLSLADYLEWVVEDGRARAVACLIERIRAPERFARAVRAALARQVPVLVLKLGASGTGVRAARSHTGSMVRERDLWRAWARASGVLEVDDLDRLLESAAYVAHTPPIEGNRIAMVTSSSGAALMLADMLEPRGFWFTPLSAQSVSRVESILPRPGAVQNPLDIAPGLSDETFGEVLSAVAADPAIDLLVVPLTVASAGGGRARAEAVVKVARGVSKPVAVCWPGGGLARRGVQTLLAARVPVFHSVTNCAVALGTALEYRQLRRRLAEPSTPPPSAPPVDVMLPSERGPLAWSAVRSVLLAAGIRVAPEVVVRDEAEAGRATRGLSYPVVVKLLGPLHKSSAGGVRLRLLDAAQVAAAVRELAPRGEACLIQPMVDGVEVLVGALRDSNLGPFVLVAPGGVHAELYGVRAMRPAPIGADDAERMLGEIPALDTLLQGYRGQPAVDRKALIDAIVRVSVMAAALGRRLGEFELNPVIATAASGAVAVDARIVLESE